MERTLRLTELAEELGGSPGAYRKLYAEGKIPGDERGPRSFWFNAEEVRAAIEEAGIKVRGFKPALSEADRQVSAAAEAAHQAGINAALGHLQAEIAGARERGDRELEVKLMRAYIDLVEESA